MNNLFTLFLLTLFISSFSHTEDKIVARVNKEIAGFLKKPYLSKTTRTFGVEGGDCGGWFCKYPDDNRNLNHYLIQNRWDCGDYGFEKNTFLVRGNKLVLVMRFAVREAEDDTFIATETIMNFSKDSIEIAERQRKAVSATDTLLTVRFKVRKVADSGQSNKIRSEMKELELRRNE